LLILSCNSKKRIACTTDEFLKIAKDYDEEPPYPMGTYFWDEFKDLEMQYGLTEEESKLLGKWVNLTCETGPIYFYYAFFPNKLFVLSFPFEGFQVRGSNEKYFNKAVGTWELVDAIVRVTIYAVIVDDKKIDDWLKRKEILFVEQPYSIDVINIDDIDPMGYTKRSVNDTVLSRELRKKVVVKEKNKTTNLLMRNVYSTDVITNTGKPEKNYGYFTKVPEMAQKKLSGMDIVSSPKLIEEYIFEMWP
jgi:hypothetical protein